VAASNAESTLLVQTRTTGFGPVLINQTPVLKKIEIFIPNLLNT